MRASSIPWSLPNDMEQVAKCQMQCQNERKLAFPWHTNSAPGRAALGSRLTVADFSGADKASREKKLHGNQKETQEEEWETSNTPQKHVLNVLTSSDQAPLAKISSPPNSARN